MRHLSGILVICALATAHAQSPAGSDASQERIVVTAAEVREFPAAVKLGVPAEQITLVDALSREAPNLSIHDAGGSSFNDVYSIRGLGNTPNFSKPAVILYVDDVPGSSTFANFPQLLGASSLTLFRGPHGDRFGKNSEAGVIDVRIDPPGEIARRSASLRIESYDMFAAQAHASGPLVADRVVGGMTVSHLQRDGYLRNTFLNTHPDDIRQTAARLAVRITPSSEWEVDLVSELHHSDDGVQRFVPLASEDPFEVAFDFDGRTRINANVQAVKVSRENGSGKWLSITSRRDWHLHPYEADFDYSPEPIVRGRFDLRQLQIAEELRYDSPEEGQVRWRAGAFVARLSSKGSEVFASPGYAERITFHELQWEAALFGGITFALANRLDLTLGMRVEHVDDEIDRGRAASFEMPTRFNAERSEWNTQPKITLQHQANEAAFFYASSAYGYKAGGFSFLQTDPRFASFDTERVWANELGARLGDLKQHRVEAKAAVFYQIVWDYQVERLAVFPDVTIFNAPEVRSCGFEAELKAELLAGWTVQAAAGYTHSEFERFSDPLTDVNYAGRRTPFTPEFTVGVSTRYKARLGIFGEVGITAAGETFYDEANTAFLRQAPYAELNARVGNGTERFSLAVYGENLNDARYFTQKIGYASIGAPAAPRRFGGSVSVKF